MGNIVTDDRVARFVSERLGAQFCPPFTCMGIETDGAVTAGVIFNQFEGPNVHVTAAGSGWSVAFMRALGRYIYEQLGCLRMTLTTESEEVAGYALRLGGEVEGRMTDYYGDGRDGIIVGVLRKRWKFGKLRRN